MAIMVHIDYPPIKKCKNPDTYGELCVRCNKCHRFNPDRTCPMCGKRTRAMKSAQTWRAIETFDDFRLWICPDCQYHFTEAEFETAQHYPRTMPFRTRSLKMMVAWRNRKEITGEG
jgi:transposase-like protein